MEVVVGFLIALLIGMTGVGAGTITAPILITLWNKDPAVAVGTALAFSTVVKVTSGLAYIKQGNVDRRFFLLMTLGGVPGVIAGSFLVDFLSRDFKSLVLFIVGVIIIVSALINIVTCIFPYEAWLDKYRNGTPYMIIPLTGFIGLEVGFTSAGAGALGTALLLLFSRLNLPKIVGTDICFGLALSSVGFLIHSKLGHVDWEILYLLLLGGVVGAFVGSMINNKYPQEKLKLALSIWLIFIASNLIYKSLEGGKI